jgi:hypothetical protein
MMKRDLFGLLFWWLKSPNNMILAIGQNPLAVSQWISGHVWKENVRVEARE